MIYILNKEKHAKLMDMCKKEYVVILDKIKKAQKGKVNIENLIKLKNELELLGKIVKSLGR